MFKVSKTVYIDEGRILDLREEKEDEDITIAIEPCQKNEYDFEQNMFAPYPQQGIPYADSGSWIGSYNNGNFE